MEAVTAPRGLIAEMITPLRKGGSIDGPGLKRLLHRVAPHVQGVFLAGPHIGEGRNLGARQRVELLEHAIQALNPDPRPILIWVSRDNEEESRRTTMALKGVAEKRRYRGDIFWVDTPLYYHSNRGLPALYRVLCSVAGRPYILHNDPALIEGLSRPFKRDNIRTAVLKELTGIREITGLIFSGSLERAHNYQRACRRRANFRIYDGEESRFLDHPSTSGVVSVGALLAPREWRRVIESSLDLSASKKEYPDHLRQIWESGNHLRAMKGIYDGAPVPILKGILRDMGLIENDACTFETEDDTESITRLRQLITESEDSGGLTAR